VEEIFPKEKILISVDWHCHLLPALDDGPTTIEESLEMAAALRKAGINAVYCTPHLLKGAFEADNQAVRSSISILQTRLKAENIDLEIFPGREYYMDEFLLDYLKDPLPLGETHLIMIEIPNHADAEFVKDTCFRIKRSGYIPMIAHPERCSLFAMPEKQAERWFKFFYSERTNALLSYLLEIGCAFQGNLGSLSSLYGETVRRNAEHFRTNRFYTHYGTDLHSPNHIEQFFNRWGHYTLPYA
jgi:protein-tyrosine phosphatase